MAINYHGRRFRPLMNSPEGQVNGETLFVYRQPHGDDLLTATYSGGEIRHGAITGLISPVDGSLRFQYQHITVSGELRSGYCESTPEVLADGRVRLHEKWRWHNGAAGESIVEEDLPLDRE